MSAHPGRILIAELELAEKEAELEYVTKGESMSPETREEFEDRLSALRQQIQTEKAKR